MSKWMIRLCGPASPNFVIFKGLHIVFPHHHNHFNQLLSARFCICVALTSTVLSSSRQDNSQPFPFSIWWTYKFWLSQMGSEVTFVDRQISPTCNCNIK